MGDNFNQPVQLRNKAMSMKELQEYLSPQDNTSSMLGLLKLLQEDQRAEEMMGQEMQMYQQKENFEREKFGATQERQSKMDALETQYKQTQMAHMRNQMQLAQQQQQQRMIDEIRKRADDERNKSQELLKKKTYNKFELPAKNRVDVLKQVTGLRNTLEELEHMKQFGGDVGGTFTNTLQGEDAREMNSRASLLTESFLNAVGMAVNQTSIEQVKKSIMPSPLESKAQYHKRLKIFEDTVKANLATQEKLLNDGYQIHLTDEGKRAAETQNEVYQALDSESQYYLDKAIEDSKLHQHTQTMNEHIASPSLTELKDEHMTSPSLTEPKDIKPQDASEEPSLFDRLISGAKEHYENTKQGGFAENAKQLAAGIAQTPVDLLTTASNLVNGVLPTDAFGQMTSPDMREVLGAKQDGNLLHDIGNIAGFAAPYTGAMKGLGKLGMTSNAAKGAVASAAVSGAADQGDLSDKAKSAALGAALDLGGTGIGKAIGKARGALKNQKVNTLVDLIEGDAKAGSILNEVGDNVDPLSLAQASSKFKDAPLSTQQEINELFGGEKYTKYAGQTSAPEYKEMTKAVDKVNAIKGEVSDAFGAVSKEDAGSVLQKHHTALDDKYKALYDDAFTSIEKDGVDVLTIPKEHIDTAKGFAEDAIQYASVDPSIRAEQVRLITQLDKLKTGSPEYLSVLDDLDALAKADALEDFALITPRTAHDLKSRAKAQNRRLELNPTETTANSVAKNKTLATRLDTAMKEQLSERSYSNYAKVQDSYRREMAPFKEFKKVLDTGKTDAIYDAVKNFGKKHEELQVLDYIAREGTEQDVRTLLGSMLTKGKGEVGEMTGAAIQKRLGELTSAQRKAFSEYIPDLNSKVEALVNLQDVIQPYSNAVATTQTGKLGVSKLNSIIDHIKDQKYLLGSLLGSAISNQGAIIAGLAGTVWNAYKATGRASAVRKNKVLIEQVKNTLRRVDPSASSKAAQFIDEILTLSEKGGNVLQATVTQLMLGGSHNKRSAKKE